MTADIGLIGLAVMGQNLALNINEKGFSIAVFNRTESKTIEFMEGIALGSGIIPTKSIENFISSLKRPRKILLMVKAGEAVDEFIKICLPYLERGDIIIDGGNSLFTDTERRCFELEAQGIFFIGAGISGGEEGARNGPSIMPGGHHAAWAHVKPIFQAISAKANNGEPCCEWIGKGGSGHYVKMVHNGIEYGDMQLIGESYHLLKNALGLDCDQLGEIFERWNQTELDSYLIEITGKILKHKDEDGIPLVEMILDVTGQKGTGKWTVNNSLDLGMPLTLISEAVFARLLSGLKSERVEASRVLQGGDRELQLNNDLIENVRQGLYASKMISYAQGFMLMRKASQEYRWDLNLGAVAMMWRGGCIIRSQFLENIKQAFVNEPGLKSLLLNSHFQEELNRMQIGWRNALMTAVAMGIPMPCFSSALAFYDGYRCENLPASLLQAQRDFFGAHTYERTDQPRGQFFHTQWQPLEVLRSHG